MASQLVSRFPLISLLCGNHHRTTVSGCGPHRSLPRLIALPRKAASQGGAPWAPRPCVDTAMIKALARAFRWRKMLDTGRHATLEDLARSKGVNVDLCEPGLRLTLLAPDIVEAIWTGGSRRR